MRILTSLVALCLALTTTACGSGPRPLVVGEDTCRFCRMTIDDVRFGALVETARGRIETFDSIECLASFVLSLPAADTPRGIWVTDFEQPGQWLPVTQAQFLRDSRPQSPMGRSYAAFAAGADLAALRARHGGEAVTWEAILSTVRAERVPSSPSSPSSPGAMP